MRIIDVRRLDRAVAGHHRLDQREYYDAQKQNRDSDSELVLEKRSPDRFPVGVPGRGYMFGFELVILRKLEQIGIFHIHLRPPCLLTERNSGIDLCQYNVSGKNRKYGNC